MHYYDELPAGYAKIFTVDFEENPTQMRTICFISLAILAVFIPLGFFYAPLSSLMPDGFSWMGLLWLLVKAVVLVIGIFAYIVLHELTHGILIRFFSKRPAKYGHNGLMYAYAYCDGYFAKGAYLTIALAPVVLWTFLLGVLCVWMPMEWFWVVYGWQLTNLSGAAGDFYVTVRFLRLPKNLLTKDDGARMVCYCASSAEAEESSFA